MDVVTPRHRTVVGTLLVMTLSVGLVLAAPLGTTSAHAHPNFGEGSCVRGYNYSDEAAGYLFASSEAFAGCNSVEVSIYNYGDVGGWGGWPGFEGTYCIGQSYLGANWGYSYTSLGVYVDSSNWQTPCSYHSAEDTWGWDYSQGGMYFLCTVPGCMQ